MHFALTRNAVLLPRRDAGISSLYAPQVRGSVIYPLVIRLTRVRVRVVTLSRPLPLPQVCDTDTCTDLRTVSVTHKPYTYCGLGELFTAATEMIGTTLHIY